MNFQCGCQKIHLEENTRSCICSQEYVIYDPLTQKIIEAVARWWSSEFDFLVDVIEGEYIDVTLTSTSTSPKTDEAKLLLPAPVEDSSSSSPTSQNTMPSEETLPPPAPVDASSPSSPTPQKAMVSESDEKSSEPSPPPAPKNAPLPHSSTHKNESASKSAAKSIEPSSPAPQPIDNSAEDE